MVATAALTDEAEGRAAILMALMQIGETLNRLADPALKERLGQEDIQGAYNVRNFIAHDYEGVNLALIENIVRNLLKPLKDELLKELKNEN